MENYCHYFLPTIFIFFCPESYPSKHLLVFKTSSRHVLKTSSTRLQRNNFSSSKTSWRRFEDISQDVLKNVFEDEKLLCWRCLEDVLKKWLEDVFRMSFRETKGLLGISASNQSKCVSNKSIFPNLYLTKLWHIQNALIWTQQFQYLSFFKTQAESLF